MTITLDWFLGGLSVLICAAIVGLIRHVVTDAGTVQRLIDHETRTKEALEAIHAQIDKGILPRTEERLNALEERLSRYELSTALQKDGENHRRRGD